MFFSAPMVRAILAGMKTQTRRLLKPALPIWWHSYGTTASGFVTFATERCGFASGMKLWVRETFVLEDTYGYHGEHRVPRDGRPIRDMEDSEGSRWLLIPHYRATEPEPHIVPDDLEDEHDDRTRWRPAIFMPRWASRISLDVTAVRVERLQDISEEDARAEGAHDEGHCDHHRATCAEIGCVGPGYRGGYHSLWDTLHTKPGTTWNDSPWVVVIEFKRFNAQPKQEQAA